MPSIYAIAERTVMIAAINSIFSFEGLYSIFLQVLEIRNSDDMIANGRNRADRIPANRDAADIMAIPVSNFFFVIIENAATSASTMAPMAGMSIWDAEIVAGLQSLTLTMVNPESMWLAGNVMAAVPKGDAADATIKSAAKMIFFEIPSVRKNTRMGPSSALPCIFVHKI